MSRSWGKTCDYILLCLSSYGGEEEVAGAGPGVDSKPRILLMGLRR